MSDYPRWTVAELSARYEFEPELADVFVEGEFDKDVLSACFKSSGELDRVVYVIDCVTIDAELMISHGLDEGQKQRVITLARELGRIEQDCRYRCLVDRDLDHWFGPLESTPRLIWTDYCSLELYYLSEDFLYHLLVVTAKSRLADWSKYFHSLLGALRDLYMARLVARELNMALDWLEPHNCIKLTNGLVHLDSVTYLDKLLNKNAKAGSRQKFLEKLAEWDTRVSGDPRNYIRGHDLVSLIVCTINRSKGLRELACKVTIERILVLSSERARPLMNRFS